MSYHHPHDSRVLFADLLGKTLVSVIMNEANDEIRLTTDDGRAYLMYHDQDCCESVFVDSIVGDLQDLVGSPILKAEEVISEERPADATAGPRDDWDESETWTFYKLATIKGYVDIRWFGSSNGYYSESVEFALLPNPEPA